jgi:N-methylhydantoinase A
MLRIGIDTGGTFTDIAVHERAALRIHKIPSTPRDPARAVLQGLADVRAGQVVDVVHGTTVGLNAVLTGKVARTAFVTNDGFRDLIEIGRQARSSLYDLDAPRAALPVPRSLRFTVSARRAADGTRVSRVRPSELTALREALARARVEAVAVGLLHSWADPADEHEIERALQPLGVPVTCSADLLPVHGEFERFAAAILNAAIGPIMGAYLERVRHGMGAGRLRLLRSSGGIMSAGEAERFPARAMFSGPAGGVMAARRLARGRELPRVAALDMGGTSTDVALIHASSRDDHRGIAGIPLALPGVGVHTIGCGGGSIARLDAGGALVVGPESAGADPGPACYGRGDQPTVTDAHMALGHMGADSLLGGRFPVDPERSVRAVERLARASGVDAAHAARGILEVAEVAMMRALLVITAQHAVDPATVTLVAFGGAGGLHAAGLLRRLGMRQAVVPRHPGAFSATGLATAGESHEEILPVMRAGDDVGRSLRAAAARLAARARGALDRTERAHRTPTRVEARVRFRGQGEGLWIPFASQLAQSFRRAHLALHGFVLDVPIEVVELRARAERAELGLGSAAHRSGAAGRAAPLRRRRAPLGRAVWDVYRQPLRRGTELRGPCLLEEETGVVLLPEGVLAICDEDGVTLQAG